MSKALILVDIQRDFCLGGSLPVDGGDKVAQDVSEYLFNFYNIYRTIVATKDWHVDPKGHFSDEPDFIHTWPVHCVVKTEGADFHPNLQTKYIDTVFYKGMLRPAYSGFEGYDFEQTYLSLENYLKTSTFDVTGSVNELDICGIATDYCVKATVMDALEKGFKVNILAALCAAVNPLSGEAALNQMHAAGATIVGDEDELNK